MSIEDDARRAVRAFFLGQTGEFGPYTVQHDKWVVLRYDGSWLLGQLSDGDVVWFSPFRDRMRMKEVFDAAEQITGLPLSVSNGSEFLLGPLGLAAFRAYLTTTTVGD